MSNETTTPEQPQDEGGFMSAEDYGRGLKGLGVNLLVRDVAKSIQFARLVLGAKLVYGDADFAVLRQGPAGPHQAEWMLHADGTYHGHPLPGLLSDVQIRGAGVEIRLYHCDPDRAVAAAAAHDYHVLAPAADKPHGMREAHVLDPDGYCWVPSLPKAKTA
jgi:catechol 2,3-dioxygenase-like lactoylglutathione lyase family enzyme